MGWLNSQQFKRPNLCVLKIFVFFILGQLSSTFKNSNSAFAENAKSKRFASLQVTHSKYNNEHWTLKKFNCNSA